MMANSKRMAFIFPGQGAQHVGMGKDFAERYPTARETFEEASDILGNDIARIAFEGPEETLTETRNSQTAIYVTSIALLRVLQEQMDGFRPVVAGGLSLGEYTALTASERLDFAHCLPLVQWRGQVMNDACEATEGTMAVIMGLDADTVEAMVKGLNLPNDLWAANFNCPGQVVISGSQKGIEAGVAKAKELGAKRAMPLQVHGAFHSGLMAQAEERLKEKVLEAPIQDSDIAFAMNAPGALVTDLEQIRHDLIKQVTSPVRWESCVHAMEELGVDLFVEIGCGKTLKGMNKRIGVAVPTVNVSQLADIDTLAAELAVATA